MATAGMAYIEKIVVKPTWKQILLELIEQNKIDPWDIDIVQIADEFMARVKQMRALDLSIHANVILAAAILLKFKSDYLRYFTCPPVEQPVSVVEDVQEPFELPHLSLVSRIPPKRPVTLEELIAEMERVLKYESAEIKRIPRGSITEIIDLNVEGEDIEKRMADVLARVRKNVDETGFATFSSILHEKTNVEIIYTLLSILHLAQNNIIDIYQEKLFGEILLSIIDSSASVTEKDKKGTESAAPNPIKKEKQKIKAVVGGKL